MPSRCYPWTKVLGFSDNNFDVTGLGELSFAKVPIYLARRSTHIFNALRNMSKKSGAIAELIDQFQGRDFDAHYLGYFECFNRRLYFEAHDVLEELWLAQRTGPNYSFYKGLIQLAGAFVHLQKNRLRPSAALFKLADANLQKYPTLHDQLRVDHVRALIADWLHRLESRNFEHNPLLPGHEPRLQLES